MTKAAAIYNFWSSFGLPAYEENSVPNEAEFPYITYQLVTSSFENEIILTASLWYRGSSWVEINQKTEEISKNIGLCGKVIACDNGKIWLKRGSIFAQNMGDNKDSLIKRKYINLSAEYFTAD